jgi:AraC-like DNA-binding protein
MSEHFALFKPNHPLLKPYIENYLYVSGELPFSSKMIPPRPGTSLLLDFKSPFYCNDNRFINSLVGFQEESFKYQPGSLQSDHLVVRFHPHGLSRFTNLPVSELTNQIVDPEMVFGPDINELHQQAVSISSPDRRIALVERFLLARYTPPSETEESISGIANMLRKNFDNVDFDSIRAQTPMSTRQLERTFKAMVGVDMQTYLRICRFDYARSLILKQPSLSLTDIGYDAGYYDQPHFSNEAKRMTGVSPKNIEACQSA